jgi:hypothetical protein
MARRHGSDTVASIRNASPVVGGWRCVPALQMAGSIHRSDVAEIPVRAAELDTFRDNDVGARSPHCRVDYAIADANDWVLADYHTMIEVEHLPYRAALTLAHRGLTVRRVSWPAHWHMIRLRQRGDLDDGAAICNGMSGQISMMSQLDRDAVDWLVDE